MSCYHKKLMVLGQRADGKYKPIFLNRHVDFQNLPVHDVSSSFLYDNQVLALPPSLMIPDDPEKQKVFQVPCGNCIGCRLDYSRTWADRIVMESMMTNPGQSWFLTLTYDDDLLPDINGNPALEPVAVDDISGKVVYQQRFSFGVPSLYPRHLELFMKRLRKRFGDGLKFFAAGEYGGVSGRPHYHLCVMNLDLQDLKFYKVNELGDVLYTSKELESIWSFGFCPVGRLNWQTAAYTARYIMKKQKGKAASFYRERNIEPEFVRMSRRPGLAASFFQQRRSSLYPVSESGDPTGSRCVLPALDRGSAYRVDSVRYFDKLLDQVDPDLLRKYKKYREDLGASSHREQRALDPGFEGRYFAFKEEEKYKSVNLLLRNL